MRRAAIALLFSSFVLVAACKDDPERPPATGGVTQAPPNPGGAGGGGGGGQDGGGAVDSGEAEAGACTAIQNEGLVVDQNRIVGEPETGIGGLIADGTYELTDADLYVGAAGTPGPSGVTFRGALQITGGTIERAHEQVVPGSAPVETRTRGTFTAAGTTVTVTQSCPAQFQDQYTYSVVNETLNLTSLLTRESYTFTLR